MRIFVGATGGGSDAKICERHPDHMQKYYCNECSVSICDVCVEESGCKLHRRSPVAAIAERLRQDIDGSFSGASTLISQKKAELESRLRALSDEKDRALLCIDSAFEAHMHTLGRRATLLKNKVIDIYNENSNALESGLEEVDTAITCVVSLREYHEAAVDNGDFDTVLIGRGTTEIDEVANNVGDRVRPPEIHIVFDRDHGIEKFRSCTKDLGRVVCNRSAPRPPDVTPTDAPSPLASVLETDIAGQNRLFTEDVVLETDGFAGGDGEIYRQFENVQLSDDAMNDSSPVGQMYVCAVPGSTASETVETLIAGGIPALHGSGDMPTVATSKSTNKTVARPTCMVTNNNYFSPQLPLGLAGCKFTPDISNVDSQSRTCTSYDEHRLQRELGTDTVDAAFCMSRSDYWPHGTCSGTIVNNSSDQGSNVIVELSGEQTTL